MSRINEALQRHGQGQATPAGTLPDVFVSAWDDAPRAETEPAPAAVPVAAAAPAAEPILTRASGPALPTLSSRWRERLASAAECDPALLEQFRRLAATLHNAQAASGLRVVLVSSARPGEGKTLTAINLAVVLSASYGRRVLLIDADLRHPSIGEVIEVTGSVGLSAALKAKSDQKLAVVPLTPTLTLLPAGPPDPDPLRGLTSDRMRQILEEASARFDWVILDGPPVGPLADTAVLAQMVDGTLFVIRAGESQHAAVEKAVASIGRERILGVVLNGTAPTAAEDYPGEYYRRNTPAEDGR